MKAKVIFFCICIVFYSFCSAQQNTVKINTKQGVWSDTTVWNDNKIPSDSDMVFLNYPLVVDMNGKCKWLNTNGYTVTVNSNVHFQIPGTYTFPGDSLQLFNLPSLYNTDTLQAHYTQGNFEYFFFGIRDTSGAITKLTSCQYKIINTTDTIVHMIYNDSANIKAMYTTINGVKDSSFFKFTYIDTMVFMSKYYIDWNKDSIAFRSLLPFKRSIEKPRAFRPNSVHQQISNLDIVTISKGFAVSAVINLIIVSGSIVVGYRVGKVFGAVIGGVIGIGLVMNSSFGAELPHFNMIPPPNSKIPFNKIIKTNPGLDNPDSTGTSLPVLGSFSIHSIKNSTAVCLGNVLLQGGSSVIQRGVCWDQNVNPTIANNKTSNGAGTGTFSSTLTGLQDMTTYYVRAYATNSTATIYGPNISFKTTGQAVDTAAVLVSHGSWTSTTPDGNIILHFNSNGTGGFIDYINASDVNDPVTTSVTWQYIPESGIVRVTTLDDWFDWEENDVINFKITSFSETEMTLSGLAAPSSWNYTFH